MGVLSGKVAIVTGAGRGIGRGIAQRFAEEGAKVALVSRTKKYLDEAVELIKNAGGTAIGIPCDVMEEGAIEAAVQQVVDTWGTVDILINNAHDVSVETMMTPVAEAKPEQLHHQFGSGAIPALKAMQACLPHMQKQGGGRIVNMGSSVGIKGNDGFLPYAMAKEAVRALTRVAAREWGQYGITVNNVCPAAMTPGAAEVFKMPIAAQASAARPIDKVGDPYEDISPVVLFLASPGAGYMTGYTLMADGGTNIDTAR